jgi:hypothetical protein
MTTATLSDAERYTQVPLHRDVLGIACGSSVSHAQYAVGYFPDKSFLIATRPWHGHPWEWRFIGTAEKTYYRSDIEHAARCLGTLPTERRATLAQQHGATPDAPVWVDGVCWDHAGELVDIS